MATAALKFKNLNKILILFILSLFLVHTAQATPGLCSNIFNSQEAALAEIRYAGGDRNRPITFGLEFEANMRENPNVVRFYRLSGYSEARWLEIPEVQRIEIARAWEKKNRLEFHKVAFRKLSGAHKDLPDILYTEGNGNFEFNGFVFKTISESKAFTQWFNNQIGATAQQGHVVMPVGPVPGAAGYTIYSSDRAQFKTFSNNYKRYLEDSSVVPAKNIVHHSLGPLGETDRQVLTRYENDVNAGKTFPKNNPSTRISNGSMFRSAGYPEGLMGWELRQFHKRTDELIHEEDLLSNWLQTREGLERFKPFDGVMLISEELFNEVKSFSSRAQVSDWKIFFNKIGKNIQSKYPGLLHGGAAPSLRFLYPLREWKYHPVLNYLSPTERKKAQGKIQKATVEYVKSVQNLINQSSTVDDSTLIQMQILIAKWGHNSGLHDVFEKFHERALVNNESPRGPPLPRGDFRIAQKAMSSMQTMSREQLMNHVDYKKIINNSIEIIYVDRGEFGHIRLRVGSRIYSFNSNFSASVYIFDGKNIPLAPEAVGAMRLVNEIEIEKYQDEILKMHQSTTANNIPPYDVYSSLVEILKDSETGTISFKPSTEKYGAAAYLAGEIVTVENKKYLRSQKGFLVEIIEKNKKMYVQSFSCSTSVYFILKEYFNIQIPFTSAKGLHAFMIESQDFIKIQ